jgi:hypothetical protein
VNSVRLAKDCVEAGIVDRLKQAVSEREATHAG